MKLLQMDVTFILPDDFTGDVVDALREVVVYADGAPNTDPGQDRGPNADHYDLLMGQLCAIRYERVEVAIERGHQLIGNANIVSDESGEWKQIGFDLHGPAQALTPDT